MKLTSFIFIGLLCLALAGCQPVNDVSEISAIGQSLDPVPEARFGPEDWPWWRGPSRNGIVPESPVPQVWSETDNVIWKSPVPGRGHSSPTVIGSRVVLATADESSGQQMIVCFNRETGEQLWLKVVHEGGLPTDGMHPKQTHATCTVASDGDRFFVGFLNDGVILGSALSLDGEILWQTDLGPFSPKFGYAPSPAIWNELVIFACDNEGGGFLVAVHRQTGRIHWRRTRGTASTYASPVVARIAGRDQLLISGGRKICSYDPMTGEELWSASGTAQSTCGTIVWDGDMIFASGGFPERETIAIVADGSGRVAWTKPVKCYEQSLLASNGCVYAVNDDGIAFCWDAASGEELWKKRLSGRFSASPVLAGDRIFVTSESGETFIFEANRERFVELSRNKLGEEAMATLTVAGPTIFSRVAYFAGEDRREFLYCLGAR